jgi:pilus assembly protein FimV
MAQTDFSQAGPGSIDTDEVDPVAEADVYMAYGRDAQAEEILLEARQKDPGGLRFT